MYTPKIAVYDIEVLSSMNADCGSICCMSWKDLNKGKVKRITLEDYPKHYQKNVFDDSMIVKDIYDVLSQYDMIIGHNILSTAKWGFDTKYINTRIKIANLKRKVKIPYLQGIHERDTYHHMAKKHLKLRSNKLINVGKMLGAPAEWTDTKDDMDFPLDWNRYIVKMPGASKKMYARNAVDVLITEFVYNELKEMDIGHPNLGVLSGISKKDYPCPICGKSDKLNNKDKVTNKDPVWLASNIVYQRYICRRCNHVHKGPKISQ